MMRIGIVVAVLSLSSMSFADETSQCVKSSKWVDAKNGQTIDRDAMLSSLLAKKVVLLGEDHDNAEHHRWQLHTIAQLHSRQAQLAIGFETFPRSVQPILDQWIEGKLDEQQFLKAVDWESVWTYDAEYYLPMFHYARMNRIPMIALNVKRSLVSQVGQRGWKNIPVNEREGVSDPAPASDSYRELLAEVFQSHNVHGHGQATEQPASNDEENKKKFERFIEGQLVWDRAMAEALSNALNKTGAKLIIGVMGAGHLINDAGVPKQLQSLGVNESVSLLPWDGTIPCEQLASGIADYVFGVTKLPATEIERPKLGVFLELDKQGVKVTKVVPKSIAAELRIRSGDYILEAQSKNVKQVSDVVKAVQNTAWGNWMPLKIKRGKKELNIIAKFPAKD